MINYRDFINEVCDFMTARANEKEKANRKGIQDSEVTGFVHGVRWCVMLIKNNIELLELVEKDKKQLNDFEEVVDFFNDIMETLYRISLGESKDNVRFARSVVYKVFSRRYKIKEIERSLKDEKK
jgi:hypothetical protein